MKVLTNFHWLAGLAIIATLVGGAFICGQSGQPTLPAPGSVPVSPPTNCTWQSASASTIVELEWEHPSTKEIDGFRIYQGTTSLELEVGSNVMWAAIENLEPGTQYHFDVRAIKGSVESVADACFVDATTGQ